MGKRKFTIFSSAHPENTFEVVRFKGHEGLSSLFEFDITLVSQYEVHDFSKALQLEVTFTIHREQGDDVTITGMLSLFELLHRTYNYAFYRAVLVPKLWRLTLTHNNQIFLNQNVQTFVTEILEQSGLREGVDFDFKLTNTYPTREFVCQYNESHFNFISRWLERDGLYYYFDSTQQGKMIITDDTIAHTPLSPINNFLYMPPTGLNMAQEEQAVHDFMLRQQPVPQSVLLKDYNYRTPQLEVKAEAEVSSHGMGEVFVYADNILSPSEAQQLAKVRAQEILCREKVFTGHGHAPFISPGFTVTLSDHFRNDFNQEYLITSTTHQGSQEAYIISGMDKETSESEKLFYRNTFTAIPTDVQYRPERLAEKPRFRGVLQGIVDGEGSGQYAELDDHGRYKVIFPFDLSGRNDGKASSWVRMAQPYGGNNHGFHFPLHKGVDVLIAFEDGDPDRPIITGAAPNPLHPSQVTSTDQTMCKITTGGQNKIHIEDKEGTQRMLFHSPTANTYLRGGAPNDPPGIVSPAEEIAGWKFNTGKLFSVQAGSKNTIIFGNKSTQVIGWEDRNSIGLRTDMTLAGHLKIMLAYTQEFAPFHSKLHALFVKMGIEETKVVDRESTVVENEMQVSEKATHGAVKNTKVAQEKTAMILKETASTENAKKVLENKMAMVENAQHVLQDQTETMQMSTQMFQDATLTCTDMTKTVESKVKLAQELTDTYTNMQITCEAFTTMAETITETCTSRNTSGADQQEL